MRISLRRLFPELPTVSHIDNVKRHFAVSSHKLRRHQRLILLIFGFKRRQLAILNFNKVDFLCVCAGAAPVGWGAKFGPEGSSIIGSPSGNPE